MNYFSITFKDDEGLGVGRTVEDRPLFFPPYEGEINDWKELVLELVDGSYPDYLASNFGGRICSARMRDILNECAAEHDTLQWLSVRVLRSVEERRYHYLHFPHPPNVLHSQKTILAGGDFVVKAVLDSRALLNHAVFTYPKDEGVSLIVNETTMLQMARACLSGIEFHRMPIVHDDDDWGSERT